MCAWIRSRVPGWCVTPAPFRGSFDVPVGNRQQVTHLLKYHAFPCSWQDLSRQRFLAPDGVCIPTSSLAEGTGTFVRCRSASSFFSCSLVQCCWTVITQATPLLWHLFQHLCCGQVLDRVLQVEALLIWRLFHFFTTHLSCSIRRRCTRTSITAPCL